MIQHNNSLHKVKGRDNHKWSRWTRGCVTEVPSLWGKYIFVGAVWRHNAPQEASRATVLPSHNARCRDSTIGALGGGDRTFTNKVGALSTTELEAPNNTTKLHHNGLWLRGDLNRLGCSNTQE